MINTRFDRDEDLSYPWIWTVLIKDATAAKAASSLAQSWGTVFGVVASAIDSSGASVVADTLLSSAGLGSSEDRAFCSLIQSTVLPQIGYEFDYVDFGFVRVPYAKQVTTGPITLDFIETADNLVSRLMLSWLNSISPAIRQSVSSQDASSSDVGTYKVSKSVSAFESLGSSSVSKTMYIIKMKRSTLTAAASILGGNLASLLAKDPAGMVSSFLSVFGEIPAQVYCFPKVVPEKMQEAKLDKGEGNSVRTVQVTFQRVPTVIFKGSSAKTANTGELVKLSAIMGTINAAEAVASGVGGVAGGAMELVAAGTRSWEALVDLSKQPVNSR